MRSFFVVWSKKKNAVYCRRVESEKTIIKLNNNKIPKAWYAYCPAPAGQHIGSLENTTGVNGINKIRRTQSRAEKAYKILRRKKVNGLVHGSSTANQISIRFPKG